MWRIVTFAEPSINMSIPKRGRPLSRATIEMLRLEELSKNRPSHIRPLSAQRRQKLDAWLTELNRAEGEVLGQYRTSVIIPNEHAYEMASLGDESLHGFESAIIARNEQYRLEARKHRVKGGLAREQKADLEAQRLADVNQDLIKEIASGKMTVGRAALKIYNRWSVRGVSNTGEKGDRQPSLRTIARHLKRFFCNVGHF